MNINCPHLTALAKLKSTKLGLAELGHVKFIADWLHSFLQYKNLFNKNKRLKKCPQTPKQIMNIRK